MAHFALHTCEPHIGRVSYKQLRSGNVARHGRAASSGALLLHPHPKGLAPVFGRAASDGVEVASPPAVLRAGLARVDARFHGGHGRLRARSPRVMPGRLLPGGHAHACSSWRTSTHYFIPARECVCVRVCVLRCALPLSCAHSAARRAPQRPTAFSTLPAATSSATHSLRPHRASLSHRLHPHPVRRRRPLRYCCQQIAPLGVRIGGKQDTRRSREWKEGASILGQAATSHAPMQR